MQIDSATPPSGFAQNDSIVEGVEISNGMKEGFNPVLVGQIYQLGLIFFVDHEDRVKGRFSVISHHIERRDT